MAKKPTPTLAELVEQFMAQLPGMNRAHESVDGGDVVEILAEYWIPFKQALKRQRNKTMQGPLETDQSCGRLRRKPTEREKGA